MLLNSDAGSLWKLGLPYVWGPVGGTNNAPQQLMERMPLIGRMKLTFRSIVNTFQFHTKRRLKKALKATDILFMSCSIAYCCNFSFNIPSPTISRCNNSLCLTCVRASSKMPTFLLESNRPMTIRLNFPLLINLLLLRTILPVMQFSGIHILSL